MCAEYGYKSLGFLNCPNCGLSFEVTTRKPKQIFCSVKCSKSGSNNHQFKRNNEISKDRLHKRMEAIIGRPDQCSECGSVGPVDLANISNEYKYDILDWEWLCRRCHMKSDGRLEAMRLRGIESRTIFERPCEYCEKMFMPSRSTTKYCSNSCGAYAQHKRKQLS